MFKIACIIKNQKSTSKKNASGRRLLVKCMASSSVLPNALLCDCDGVVVETEKDGHCISFNDTFAEAQVRNGLGLLVVVGDGDGERGGTTVVSAAWRSDDDEIWGDDDEGDEDR
ncbi:unnamed protein product [Fraxinus pennsylvanica]|uniref:Uncharacterized protein n=1 Tax=Fraxinus pennsylvanica TaxID=56036 RepID=A0AAD1ZSV7_9LAMI|nr:unnamed protein product [Fraxinus pennsylvanica]